ncbi:MerR family transcriptional regulator [Plantibacter sp. YIM 135347]|uniref:MerR family transcriptional regulator n=1 Tax=Plantibacter sp. YIM 135347 TaxID=3423919 RepID=UPI003D349625
MAWSTRELAELAGTTVNAVRHYHRRGLLDDPEREHNGYKQYGVHDLVRLLRIRRLVELGVPLSRMHEVVAGGVDVPATLREVDAELAASMDRIDRAREDIAAILREGSPADGPQGYETVASKLSESHSALVHVYSQLYDDVALADIKRMIASDQESDAIDEALDALPPEADDATRQRVALLLAPAIARNIADYPWIGDPTSRLSKSEDVTRRTMVETLRALYSPAQLDVLQRANLIAQELIRRPDGERTDTDDADTRA